MAEPHSSSRHRPASQVPGGTLTEVRLEMRSGAGRPVVYEVEQDGFLVGSVPGCDLRLPGADLPPVICLVSRRDDAACLRKLAPTQSIQVNGQPFSGKALADGDRIVIGATELAVEFVFEVTPYVGNLPTDDDVEAGLVEADPQLRERERQLALRQREIDERFQALEAERRSWQLRRQEMEVECRQSQVQQREIAQTRAELDKRRQELDLQLAGMSSKKQTCDDQSEQIKKKQDEIESVRQELAKVRQELYERYRERRDRLAGVQEAVSLAARKVQERKRLIEVEEEQSKLCRQEDETRRGELEARAQQLEQERQKMLEQLEAWQTREQQMLVEHEAYKKGLAQYHEDLVLLERSRASLEEREKRLQEKIERLERDQRDQEEQARQLQEWHDQLGAEADRIAERKNEGEGASAHLTQRIAALETQQTTLATLRTRLEQMRDDLREEEQQLTAERARQETMESDLRKQWQETHRLRAALDLDKATFDKNRQEIDERAGTLADATARLKQMQETLAAEEQRQRQRAVVLDATAAQQVEEANLLQVRTTQLMEMQERLNTERQNLREREAELLQSEQARQALQDQLRRRSEELSARQKSLADQARQREAEMADLEARRVEVEREREQAADRLVQLEQQILDKSQELEGLQAELVRREEVVRRHVDRLKEAGRNIGQARKSLVGERHEVEAEREAAADAARQAQAEIDAIRAEVVTLQQQLPDFEMRAQAAAEKLSAAREQLCEHLGELHAYARQRQEDLEGMRVQVFQEAERIQQQARALHRARDEHRLSVAGFRQQIIAWQGQVADLKRKLAHDETRLERRQAQVDEAARAIDETSARLARQAEQLHEQEFEVAFRRDEVDRHLVDMREWYRRKLRELAAGRIADYRLPLADGESSSPAAADGGDKSEERDILALTGDVDPGDRRLGELLRSLELVDADTLTALLVEARRQRRSLRQVLLASGHVTLYQMALIEAGNVDGLMLGPVRVVDRLRMTPRETVYRVFDPRRAVDGSGYALLRHLAEAEMQIEGHADDFRRSFKSATTVQHPNLANTYEVLDIAGRPAALQEWLNGLNGTEWSELVSVPGVCYRLLCQAALGLQTAHQAGLVHGRISAAHMVLTGEGILKISGFGEPLWLNPGPVVEGLVPVEGTAAEDLMSLGRIASVWIPASLKTKGSKKSAAQPLSAIIQRLTSEDAGQRYANAAALLEDLDRIGGDVPPNAEAWERLLRVVREQGADETALRQSA